MHATAVNFECNIIVKIQPLHFYARNRLQFYCLWRLFQGKIHKNLEGKAKFSSRPKPGLCPGPNPQTPDVANSV